MASTTYSSYPIQRNFIDQPTGSGGSTTIYAGSGATSPLIYRTSGTGTWTFILPPATLLGNRIEFMNNSTGLVTINASDNSLVGTILAGASTLFSQTSLGGTNASWSTATTQASVSGILPIANGGTGQITANAGFNAISPMTTAGDIIYGGASGVATRLAAGTTGQTLTTGGSGSIPAWTNGGTATTGTFTPTFDTGSGTYSSQLGSWFRTHCSVSGASPGTIVNNTTVTFSFNAISTTVVGSIITLPHNSSSINVQKFTGLLVSGGSPFHVYFQLPINSNQLTVMYAAGGVSYAAGSYSLFVSFTYQSV
jgi:hypothetical protein